ncbi:MAG: hypothetical protein ACTSRG_13430 [Candidatus Helarchaeota archaeon]
MVYDCVLLSLPAYTTQIPSLGIIDLLSYLENKGFKVTGVDFSPDFFKKK